MGKARRKYTDADKAEVVELVINSGRPVAEIARELGINEGTLGNWMNMTKKRGEVIEAPLSVDERARLKGIYSAGVSVGGSQAPVVKSWRRMSSLSSPHLVAVSR
jgi:transposase